MPCENGQSWAASLSTCISEVRGFAMLDRDKSKQELSEELAEMRRRVAALETALQEYQSAAAVLQIAPLGIHEIDAAGRIMFVNRSQEAITGYPADELLGTCVWDHIEPGPTRDSLPAYLQYLVAEQPAPTPYFARNIKKNGEVFDVRIDWTYKRNAQGQVAGFVTVLSDITERKRAEEALQKAHDELEQRVKERTAELAKANEELDTFRRFAGDAEDGFGMSDFDGRIVYANPALCRLFGEEKPEDVIGRSVFAYYPEEYVQRRNDELIPALLREGHLHLEQVVLPRRGKPIRTLQSSFLIRDENEDPFRVGVVISDITAQKQAEEALQRQHQTLKNLLRSSDHERQLIAYEIHDGLAQQLAGAIMQFETFDYLKDKDPKEAAEACHAGLTMLRQGHFEARRLIAGVRPPVLDESGVVEAVAHLVHEVGRDKRLKIENRSRVDFGRLDPTLENAVYRIVQEALTNACLHSKSARVSVGLVQRGDRLRIEVRDWGAGFDPKAVPKDRFGLEGIRQRARLLCGKSSIRSAAGKGTRVTVELPLVPRDDA
jgi:PAS domain S-box-containing protein